MESNNKQFHPFLHYPLLDQLTRARSARDLITLGANLACNRSTQNVFHLDFKLFS